MPIKDYIITKQTKYVIKFLVLIGEVAAPCNLQSAIAGMKSFGGKLSFGLPYTSSIDGKVLRNRYL